MIGKKIYVMNHVKNRLGIIIAALGTLVPATLQAQTTPFNSSAASPCPEVLIEQKYVHVTTPRYRAQCWDTAITSSISQI